jgi:prepilin-type N-terminal cleavage/methylation domain-containing protein
MGLTRTLPQMTFNGHTITRVDHRYSPTMVHSGFSLIEMLVVMGLIVLIVSFALPSISSFLQVSINSATRDLATNIKEAYNASMITGQVYRMAYDLKKNEFWVESGPGRLLIDTTETLKKEEARKKFSRLAADEPTQSPFKMDKTITRRQISLPTGVSFEDIVSQKSRDPITEGKAYTHFFPHGVTEQTIIHLTDKSNHKLSLVVTPLLGKVDLYNGYLKQDEIFKK